jgi:hypothetical protein
MRYELAARLADFQEIDEVLVLTAWARSGQ